ncbi:uncharacterized protein LTR77_011195 [Saxophila tyrrhenica]|uniref:Chitinase n=1 Tax=Saxophila tyrrhenica TaxID=1690608 RepID=A0AAV9NUW3_9PEZI|nr:hypothetical protein LTR77_011195 [Saxophila tyrrhenica]
MPPLNPTDLLPLPQGPRLILYHQTHHHPNHDQPVSLLPFITNPTGVTHLILAAVHLNSTPGDLTLNDNPPSHPKFATLWSEVAWLRATGIKCLAMLGGAAKGTFTRLATEDEGAFRTYYEPLRDFLRTYDFDGMDLDVEEEVSLSSMIRLIDTLRADFGPEFLITMAPVATALLVGQPHLSGFNYFELERQRGREIAWYNVQFYNGWGSAGTTMWYDAIVAAGWASRRVVLGLLTSPKLGSGFVRWEGLGGVLRTLRSSEPAGEERPWEWAERVAGVVRRAVPLEAPVQQQGEPAQQGPMRPFGASLPTPAHPYPAESVKSLQDLGFNQQQAVAALNATDGNIEQAAGLLFAD